MTDRLVPARAARWRSPAREPVGTALTLVRRWARHDIAHGRFALWLPVLCAAGIGAGVAAPVSVPPLPLAGALFALIAARLMLARSRVAVLAPVALAAAAILAGALALAVQETAFGTAVLTRAQTAEVAGRIVAREVRGSGVQRIIVRLERASIDGPLPHRVRVSVRGGEPLAVGMRIEGRARLFPLPGPVLPGGYDPARRLYFDRIGATGFSYGPPTVTAAPEPSLASGVAALRDGVEARVRAVLPGTEGAFAAALLMGHRGPMDPDDVEALRLSGLGHILAISGLHMTLVAGSVFAGVRLALALVPAVALRLPIKKIAAVAGLLAALFYLALSGGSVATVRAALMLGVALLAVLVNRPALTLRTVAVAAFVVMVIDPVSVAEPSFQMSFLAVVALVGAYEWWSHVRLRVQFGVMRPVALFILGLAATSLIAALATGPLAAYHFHRVAPLGLVANLAAMPILTLAAMPAGVLALALMPLGLEAAPLAVMGFALDSIAGIARHVADWSGNAGATGQISSAGVLLMVAGLLWLAIQTAPWRLAGLAAVAVGLAVAPLAPRYDLFATERLDTVAARAPDGQLAIIGRPGGFAAEMIARADGAAPPLAGGAQCDPLGCTLPLGSGVVALANSPRALAEDCSRASVVVTAHTARRCPAALVIDRDRIRRHGAVAAFWDGARFVVHAARPGGMRRPWHVAPNPDRP